MLEELKKKKFMVVGDVLVDYYRIVRATRVSPEAPVMIVEPVEEHTRPGGAANVVANLLAMGAGQVCLASVVGKDYDALENFAFPGEDVLYRSAGRQTTIKERIVTKRQQLLRIDRQTRLPILEEEADRLFESIIERQFDVLVLSDYDHGVMLDGLAKQLVDTASDKGIPTIVDSKARNTLDKYSGCTIALPNSKEAKGFSTFNHGELGANWSDREIVEHMRSWLWADAVGMTMGPDGILLCTHEKTELFPPLEPDVKDEVVDVTGAGDTVTAAVAAGIALRFPYDKAIRLANVAAGIVVQKMGVATASAEEIAKFMEK